MVVDSLSEVAPRRLFEYGVYQIIFGQDAALNRGFTVLPTAFRQLLICFLIAICFTGRTTDFKIERYVTETRNPIRVNILNWNLHEAPA